MHHGYQHRYVSFMISYCLPDVSEDVLAERLFGEIISLRIQLILNFAP